MRGYSSGCRSILLRPHPGTHPTVHCFGPPVSDAGLSCDLILRPHPDTSSCALLFRSMASPMEPSVEQWDLPPGRACLHITSPTRPTSGCSSPSPPTLPTPPSSRCPSLSTGSPAPSRGLLLALRALRQLWSLRPLRFRPLLLLLLPLLPARPASGAWWYLVTHSATQVSTQQWVRHFSISSDTEWHKLV